MTRLLLSGSEWRQLRGHLLQNAVEQAAVVFARPVGATMGTDAPSWGGDTSAPLILGAAEIYCCTPEDFAFQSAYHIALTDEAQARLIKRAWDLRAAFVEFHSHVGSEDPDALPGSTGFSPSDLSGFEEFVPHVRWRLRGVPYIAVVVGESGFDALVWRDEAGNPDSLTSIDVDGVSLTPTHRTLTMLLSERRGYRGMISSALGGSHGG